MMSQDTEQHVKEKLKGVIDPELGISIIDLGLVYDVAVGQDGMCVITMTLTTIGCPLFDVIEKDIESKVKEISEIKEVKTELTFDPPWTPDKMTEDAKIELGLA
jgi:metal-sulfur cluster biosynthetic enzyme